MLCYRWELELYYVYTHITVSQLYCTLTCTLICKGFYTNMCTLASQT
jgi:hypothetical protein